MRTTKKLENPAELAVQVIGSQEKLARALNPPLTRQAIGDWVKKKRIPLSRVCEVSRVTGLPKGILSPAFKEQETAS